MRLQIIFLLALAVIVAFVFQNVNGEEHNLEFRQRRDGPRHHPDVGRNIGPSNRRNHGQSPINKDRHGSRDRSHSSGKNKHQSSRKGQNHKHKSPKGGRKGPNHGKQHKKHRGGAHNDHY